MVYKAIRYIYGTLAFIFIVILIRTFVFDIYYVPSSSMEKTLFPGDYVLVNKIAYGAKVPTYFADIPVIGALLKEPYLSSKNGRYTKLKAFKEFQREDLIVFKSVEKKNSLLIKRLIGMPGDTLEIVNSTVFINGQLLTKMEFFSYRYLDSLGRIETYTNKEFDTLSRSHKAALQKMIVTKAIFPFSKQKEWTIDNYGPIIIPKKGMTISLTQENIALYKHNIHDYETELKMLSENTVSDYTFKHNYYFALGDNRHNSIDSRIYGFIPENYIQGKMAAVIFRD
ncbi:signal peptidase I [Kordia sp. YSTF-M3]|uniref:Signal peptidase I n=1 Tax=Kordia aestuariivivens TaxID=2759037 RepID=A0ABR7Q6V5_9FLAO|nr:signal peptidase I [Kordia aestuariivivens]MBC8754301.1 signal peptidase I [Kordia aestuariivivens]